MLTPVTLSPKEFSDLHNAKCELYQVAKTVKETGMMKDLAKQLAKIERAIDKSLKNAYAAEDKISDYRRRLYDSVRKLHDFTSIWSMYEVTDMSQPHPFKGATTLVHKHHFNKVAVVVPITGGKWFDLYKAADAAIKASGDSHHCYIEGFDANDKTENKGVLVLSTGS